MHGHTAVRMCERVKGPRVSINFSPGGKVSPVLPDYGLGAEQERFNSLLYQILLLLTLLRSAMCSATTNESC